MKYVHQIPDSDSQRQCVCGKVLSRKKNSGFTNLFNHIKLQHPEYAETNQPKIASCFPTVPQKASNIYAWVKYLCLGLKPFCAVGDPITRDLGRYHDPISVNTLKKYMDLITKELEKKCLYFTQQNSNCYRWMDETINPFSRSFCNFPGPK